MASTAPASQSVDTETVKRHLTAARDSLSQLTQLPAAAQLTGDARTQVSQLISNFNELITTKTEWRASYGKLQANLTALVGDESAAMPAAPATATPGAVGTSGTAAVDPAIRAKLVEFRAHLTEFEKAAGGASAGGASSSASAPAASAAPAATPSPDSTASPTAATTTSSSPTPSAPAAATPSPSAPTEPSPTGTSGTTTPTPAAASSSASTTASVTPKSTEPSDTTSQTSATPAGRQATDAMRHIEAIEAILNGSAETAGTTGSSASKSTGTAGASSLDRVQIEKIRTHLSELRKALNK